MIPDPVSSPAFGRAELSNCEREQIHLAGSIQPHGALLVVDEPGLTIIQTSENAARVLSVDRDPLGVDLDVLCAVLATRVRGCLAEDLATNPRVLRCALGDPPRGFDVILHRPPAGGLILEIEPAGPVVDPAPQLEAGLQAIIRASSLRALSDEAASAFKAIAGYDRVMVYRFDDDGHGEVIAERLEPHLEAYLGNRYPASDIPQVARRLYERHRIRLLVDADYTPVSLRPKVSPMTGAELDMSLCTLRSMSPIHLQYLKNMGVGATLVASLLVGGRLWGLIACHHQGPRFVHYEVRAVCEVLAEAVATRIAALESAAQARAELAVRRLEQRMAEVISREGDWATALFDDPRALLQVVDASGVALLCNECVRSAGDVPGTRDLRRIGAWLSAQSSGPVLSTASLRRDAPSLDHLTPVASGILAATLSRTGGEYLIWCRPERVHAVIWGGDPFKAVSRGDDPAQLSPRRSFAQWREVVEGTSDPWTPANLATARLIGESVADVMQQFRAVRVVIAQGQLAQLRAQVEGSDLPVVIADATGVVALATESFERLLAPADPRPVALDDLARLFVESVEVRRRLHDLLHQRRPWRGEVGLRTAGGARPFLVRADPVVVTPDQVLGHVVLLTDLGPRKTADQARDRVHEDLMERQRLMRHRLHWTPDAVYRDLLSAVVGNAQLAALEVTDAVDLGRVPELVDAVQTSVERTTRLLEQLAWYADQARPQARHRQN